MKNKSLRTRMNRERKNGRLPTTHQHLIYKVKEMIKAGMSVPEIRDSIKISEKDISIYFELAKNSFLEDERLAWHSSVFYGWKSEPYYDASEFSEDELIAGSHLKYSLDQCSEEELKLLEKDWRCLKHETLPYSRHTIHQKINIKAELRRPENELYLFYWNCFCYKAAVEFYLTKDPSILKKYFHIFSFNYNNYISK